MSADRFAYQDLSLWAPLRRGLFFIVLAEWVLAASGLIVALAPDYLGAWPCSGSPRSAS